VTAKDVLGTYVLQHARRDSAGVSTWEERERERRGRREWEGGREEGMRWRTKGGRRKSEGEDWFKKRRKEEMRGWEQE
jgi:hypothetical protein